MLSIQVAIHAFITGWVYSRRMERDITVVLERNSIPHLRFGDSPLRQRPDEFMIFETPPNEVVSMIREADLNSSHLLTVFTNDPQATLDAYTQYGYRLFSREYLMVMALEPNRNSLTPNIPVQRVVSEEDRQWFNAAQGREVIPSAALTDSQISYYSIRHGDKLVCEGRCVLTAERIAVIDSVYTAEGYRRRGFGTAVMNKILTDAAQQGATDTVLAASEDGHKLYLTLGSSVLADMLSLKGEE